MAHWWCCSPTMGHWWFGVVACSRRGDRGEAAGPRHTVAVLPGVLRCSGVGDGPGRYAGQRRARPARLHRPAGRHDRSRRSWSRRWTLTGDRTGGSPRSRRTRHTGSAADGGEEVPDTLNPQVPIIERRARRGRAGAIGAAGYEADDVIGTLADDRRLPGRHRDRRPRPVPAGRRRRTGPGSLHRPRAVATCDSIDEAEVTGGTGSPDGRTPSSPRCAATPPTGCPACPESATRPPPP